MAWVRLLSPPCCLCSAPCICPHALASPVARPALGMGSGNIVHAERGKARGTVCPAACGRQSHVCPTGAHALVPAKMSEVWVGMRGGSCGSWRGRHSHRKGMWESLLGQQMENHHLPSSVLLTRAVKACVHVCACTCAYVAAVNICMLTCVHMYVHTCTRGCISSGYVNAFVVLRFFIAKWK